MAPFDGALHLPLAAARADGVRTMMMGHLGDLVVAGTPLWFSTLLRPSRTADLAAEVRAHAGRNRTSVARAFLATVAFRLLPARAQQRIEYRRRPDYRRWLPAALGRRYDIDLRAPAYAGRHAWWRQLRDSIALVGQSRSSGYFDRMFRHFGLEQRQPFLDTRLLMAILSLPPQAFYSRGQHKRILRTSLSDVLPPLVRDRQDKASFAPLAEFGLRGPYRSYVQELTRASELVAAGLVREAPWQQSIASFLEGDLTLGWVPWRSLTLEMWLRRRAGRLPPV
jgi:asparagine synthetase B (glutamine-hydrolysing)